MDDFKSGTMIVAGSPELYFASNMPKITIPPPTTVQTNAKYHKLPKTPTNEHGQATKLHLCWCKTGQMITFHITWITFWLCFFVWFCTTNIYHQISTDLHLTFAQHQLAGALSITSTLFFRLIISDLCFKYGARVSYVIILISTALSLVGMALIQSVTGYIIFHLFLGIAGASFVVTQYHITRMFCPQIVGFTQATAAGFANSGGGAANFVMPLLIDYFALSWRWYMVIFAAIVNVFCFVYYFGTSDHPKLPPEEQPVEPRFPIDLVEMDTAIDREPPDKQSNLSFKDAITDHRTWTLFVCYAACFGVEITFYLVGAHYFQSEYDLTPVASGLIVMIWSAMNIVARPLGVWVSDKYEMVSRAKLLCVLLFCESIFLILFGMIGDLSLYAAIAVCLAFSIPLQMAKGVVFNIARLIQPKSVGFEIGIVGSGGNLGAAFFIFAVFVPCSMITDLEWLQSERYAWIMVGGMVLIIAFAALGIKFTERELLETKQNEQACYDLDGLETDDSNRSGTAV